MSTSYTYHIYIRMTLSYKYHIDLLLAMTYYLTINKCTCVKDGEGLGTMQIHTVYPVLQEYSCL